MQKLSMNLWDIRRSVIAKSDDLDRLPNLSHVTLGEKVRKGVPTGERAVVAYVSKKKERLEEDEKFPSSFSCQKVNGDFVGDIQTDVQEIAGEIRAFGLRSGHVIRGFDGDHGVSALAYENEMGQKRLMTNAHVVVDVENNGATGLPSFKNRVDNNYYQLGKLQAVSKLRAGMTTTHDVAVIEVPSAYDLDEFMIQDQTNDIDRIAGISTLSNHNYWFVVGGEKFECGFPERVVKKLPVKVDGVIVHYAECWQFRMTRGRAKPGQSGALICRNAGAEIIACGMVFGGIEPSHIFAFPFNKMWNKFKKF